jgi:ubiquinone/menaquinone biosynthesis C-methylase UbiE
MTETMTAEKYRGYDRSAGWLDAAETCLEAITFMERLRKRAWSGAKGPLILEIGVGSGRGLPYHPPEARVIAFDFSPSLLKRTAAKADRNGSKTDLFLADVNYLPFKDRVFDTVLATFVFCMVPEPVGALSEVSRACRGDGQVVLLEHVRPENLLGPVADAMNVFTKRGNEYVNRDTASNVRKAGLEITREEKHRMSIVKLLHARPRVGAAAREKDNVVA